jgi:hypothetical protein
MYRCDASGDRWYDVPVGVQSCEQMGSMNSPKQDRLENIATSKPSEPFKSTGSNGAIAGMGVLLAVAVFLVFGQTLRREFVNYDDGQYFSSNLRENQEPTQSVILPKADTPENVARSQPPPG